MNSLIFFFYEIAKYDNTSRKDLLVAHECHSVLKELRITMCKLDVMPLYTIDISQHLNNDLDYVIRYML